MKSRLLPSLSTLGTVVLLLTCARAEETTTTLKFSDPTKPGTVKINLGRGELRVQGADTNEVSVKSEGKSDINKPRKDGMRVLSAASSFALKESDNTITLDAASDLGKGNSAFRLSVPRNTAIVVQNAWGGDITCSGISGDLEINSMHGEIRLDDVAGGVVAGTMNGEIHASIRELREGKPLSFTSMNGEVVLRVPQNARANVRLRTQNGSVLTDFDDTVLVTKSETTTGDMPRGRHVFAFKSNKVLSQDIQDAIREATQLSANAIREALEAVREGFEAARLDADDARRQVEDARREMDRARRERKIATARANGSPEGSNPSPAPTPPAKPAVAPLPPKMPIPTITGGKLVTGTLNGGGPEISVSTMNGDVTLRKLEAKN